VDEDDEEVEEDVDDDVEPAEGELLEPESLVDEEGDEPDSEPPPEPDRLSVR